MMSRVSKYVCVLVLCMTVQAHAQMAVFDTSNFSQNVVSAKQSLLMTFKQIQQYCLQIQQYEQQIQQSTNMVKNTVAPIAYVWDQALVTMNDVLQTINVVDRYTQQAGSLQAYLNQFQDVNYYRSSPCFGPNGCTQQQLGGTAEDGDTWAHNRKNRQTMPWCKRSTNSKSRSARMRPTS